VIRRLRLRCPRHGGLVCDDVTVETCYYGRRHRRPTVASDDVTVETCYYGRRHRRPAVQGSLLLLQRRFQERRGLGLDAQPCNRGVCLRTTLQRLRCSGTGMPPQGPLEIYDVVNKARSIEGAQPDSYCFFWAYKTVLLFSFVSVYRSLYVSFCAVDSTGFCRLLSAH